MTVLMPMSVRLCKVAQLHFYWLGIMTVLIPVSVRLCNVAELHFYWLGVMAVLVCLFMCVCVCVCRVAESHQPYTPAAAAEQAGPAALQGAAQDEGHRNGAGLGRHEPASRRAARRHEAERSSPGKPSPPPCPPCSNPLPTASTPLLPLAPPKPSRSCNPL